MSASLSITLFVNGIALGIFMLPRMYGTFSKNQFADLIIKRCCIVIAIYLFMLNSAIMSTIAVAANIGVTQELFRYMWLLGWAGYVSMAFMVLKTLFDVKDMYKTLIFNRRMGGGEDRKR